MMQYDPLGSIEEVVVLKARIHHQSHKHSRVEETVYQSLVHFQHRRKQLLRDEVRRLAATIAESINDTQFVPSVDWLNDFMRRYSLGRKLREASSDSDFLLKQAAANYSLLRVKQDFEDTEELENRDQDMEGSSLLHRTPKTADDKNSQEYPSSNSLFETVFIPEDEDVDSLDDSVGSMPDISSCLEVLVKEDDIQPSSVPVGPKPNQKPCPNSDASEVKVITIDSSSDNASSGMIDSSDEDDAPANTDTSITYLQDGEGVSLSYSAEENSFLKLNFKELHQQLQKKVCCTTCNKQIHYQVKDSSYVHRALGVLMCRKCYYFYGDGDFTKDEEGFDEYCRWCGQGGDLMLCDSCTNGFCKACIKRNIGRAGLSVIEKAKKWSCYVCDVRPLMCLRAIFRIIYKENNKSTVRPNVAGKTVTPKSGRMNKNEKESHTGIHDKKKRRITDRTSGLNTPKQILEDHEAENTESKKDSSEKSRPEGSQLEKVSPKDNQSGKANLKGTQSENARLINSSTGKKKPKNNQSGTTPSTSRHLGRAVPRRIIKISPSLIRMNKSKLSGAKEGTFEVAKSSAESSLKMAEIVKDIPVFKSCRNSPSKNLNQVKATSDSSEVTTALECEADGSAKETLPDSPKDVASSSHSPKSSAMEHFSDNAVVPEPSVEKDVNTVNLDDTCVAMENSTDIVNNSELLNNDTAEVEESNQLTEQNEIFEERQNRTNVESNADVQHVESTPDLLWVDKCLNDMEWMLTYCLQQVKRLQTRWTQSRTSYEVACQSVRRMHRLSRSMHENFSYFDATILEENNGYFEIDASLPSGGPLGNTSIRGGEETNECKSSGSHTIKTNEKSTPSKQNASTETTTVSAKKKFDEHQIECETSMIVDSEEEKREFSLLTQELPVQRSSRDKRKKVSDINRMSDVELPSTNTKNSSLKSVAFKDGRKKRPLSDTYPSSAKKLKLEGSG